MFIHFLKNSDQISQEFCCHTIVEEFNRHLNCGILRLAKRILIKVNENVQNNSMVIYFLKNSDQIQCNI